MINKHNFWYQIIRWLGYRNVRLPTPFSERRSLMLWEVMCFVKNLVCWRSNRDWRVAWSTCHPGPQSWCHCMGVTWSQFVERLLNSPVSIFLLIKQGFIIILHMVIVRTKSIISVEALSKPQNALSVMSLFLSW